MSTLHTSETTHQGVLPQPPALESEPADNPRVGTKRGSDASARSHTGVQHGRGETPDGYTCPPGRHPVSGNRHGSRGRKAPVAVAARVGVCDRNGIPLQPCHPARARKLLASGRAVVAHASPFVIRLRDRDAESSVVQGVEEGIDPGSRYTGMALFRVDGDGTRHGVFAVQVNHRGHQIHAQMLARAQLRRGRRSRKLRYRAPRFDNRTRPDGWLPPSLRHRVDGVVAWHQRLSRWFPVTAVHLETVRFDTQKLVNPEITGTEYQQGTLAGFEVREYLLAKWQHRCAYCGATGVGPQGVPLNIDHIHPRSRGGTDRVANLTLACVPCNQAKGAQPVEVFLAGKPAQLATLLAQAKAPLRDAAAVNTTRRALHDALSVDGLLVRSGSGGQTKWNRAQNHLPKSHTLDALAVGQDVVVACFPSRIHLSASTGRGIYARTIPDKYGFPRLQRPRAKRHFGFATGDLVVAVVPTGRAAGRHVGRVAVRSRGSFNVKTSAGLAQGIHHRHCRLIQRADGWNHGEQKEVCHAA